MTFARVLGGIGRTFISAGVIILLFVAYQLWGTGLQHAQAQGNLEDELGDRFALLAEEVQPAAPNPDDNPVIDEPGDSDGGEGSDGSDDGGREDGTDPDATPASNPDGSPIDLSEVEYSDAFLAALYPGNGDALARIVMETINVDQVIVEGVQVEDLRKGPGHYRTTPMPGQEGNAAIAGHRTTYGAPFHRVDELQPGDEIKVETLQGVFTYRVMGQVDADGVERGHFIVSPSATEVLGQDFGDNRLTLTACHPKYSARQRIIVVAELVGEPAPTLPRPGSAEAVAQRENLDSGAEDEGGQTDGGPADEIENDSDVVISDEVAADDDPDVAAPDDPATADDPEAAEPEAELVDDTEVADDEELSDDFGEGLEGDRSAILPSVTWGIAAFFLWLAASFIGRRLSRKWLLYGIFLLPFAFTLWSVFVNVDQALPAY